MAERKKRARAGISLPWEGRAFSVRRFFEVARWRAVVLVLALALGSWGVFRAADDAARTRRTRHTIDEVHRAIADFRADVGRCPHGAAELLRPPRSAPRYLREEPRDGWGHPLFVRCPDPEDPDGAEVVAAGPSGDFFTDDNLR